MSVLVQLAIAIVALLHVGILILEMFLWDTSIGRRIFGTSPDFASQASVLAANQGLYNGFLAAGLIWSLVPVGAPEAGAAIAGFFLFCITIAGLYGMATVSYRTVFIQTLPALVALALLWLT